MQVPLSILTYRRVVPRPDPLFPEQIDARRFDQQVKALARHLGLPHQVSSGRTKSSTRPVNVSSPSET